MNKLISYSTLTLMFFLLVFTRSFAGIYIFGIRLGEYLVAFGLVLSFAIVFIPNKYEKTFGQFSKIEKMKMDHRYQAFKKLKRKIKTL